MTMTITDKRSRSKLTNLMGKFANLYDRAFVKKSTPGFEFWKDVDAIDLQLTKMLNKRPTTPMELDDAGRKAIAAFVEACVRERAR